MIAQRQNSRLVERALRATFSWLVLLWPIFILIALITGAAWMAEIAFNREAHVWLAIAAVAALSGWGHLRTAHYVRELRQRDHDMRNHIAMMETRIAQKRG